MYTRSNRRSIPGCISSLVLLLLIVGGLGFVLVRAHNGTSVAVGNHPTVIIHDCDAPIIVHAGQARQVVFSGIFPQYQQDTSTDTIELADCNSIGGFNGVMLTVPPQTNLQLDSTNYSITVFGVSGQMSLSANGARITLVNVTLEGQSKVDGNGGMITLIGNLAQGSNSLISDNSGTIDMTLPTTTAFHLDASGNFGPVVSDYTVVQAPSAGELHVDVGRANSGVTLGLNINDTALILHK